MMTVAPCPHNRLPAGDDDGLAGAAAASGVTVPVAFGARVAEDSRDYPRRHCMKITRFNHAARFAHDRLGGFVFCADPGGYAIELQQDPLVA